SGDQPSCSGPISAAGLSVSQASLISYGVVARNLGVLGIPLVVLLGCRIRARRRMGAPRER
ncbi:MAG: hypothetical protein KC466_08585, partial [Myxococcales bacterium]|nr:hypothetical protein [Myxococcales bacterium]